MDRAPDRGRPQAILLDAAAPFERSAAWLRNHGWWHALPHFVSSGIPLIALDGAGHLLVEGSEEAPREHGMGLVPGLARRYRPGGRGIHVGWCPVREVVRHPSIPDPQGVWLHVRHAYALECDGSTLWDCPCGDPFSMLSARGRVLLCQAQLAQSGSSGRWMLQRLLTAVGAETSRTPETRS